MPVTMSRPAWRYATPRRSSPKNAKARYLMALLAEQKEDYKGMFNHLLVAVDADPANIEARLKLGMVFIAIGDWASAAEQSDALLKLAPEDARVVLLQARVDLQNGNLSAGRAGLEKSMQLDPANSDPVLILGALEAADDLDRGSGDSRCGDCADAGREGQAAA